LSVSSPTATNPLCSSTLREAGLSSVTLARSLVSSYSVAASSRTLRTAATASPWPAAFCLVLILEAYTGVSDDEVIEAQMDRRLIERTIEIAAQSRAFGSRALRAALDSSPLWGAGRVEDTYNLVGHALKKVMRALADQQGRELVELAQEAGAELVSGSSLKAVLDRDWDQPREKEEVLSLVLQVLQTVEAWPPTLTALSDQAAAHDPLKVAQQVREQDVQVDEKGKASLIKGVAKDRRISVEDAEMRHGRKSRSVRVDGYKRHVLHDLDTGLIRAVGVTPANAPEASVTESISADLAQQSVSLTELHIDRAYLSSHLVRERSDELEVYCKAWPVRSSKRFHKQAFALDWERQVIRCPASQEMPFKRAMHHQCQRAQCQHPSR
jgi:lambda repressor-like predicted transcriptional regulator